jgi:hypothetical protein
MRAKMVQPGKRFHDWASGLFAFPDFVDAGSCFVVILDLDSSI